MVGSNVLTQRLLKLWIPLLLYAVFLLFPFAWMLIVSIKPDQLLLDTRINPFAIISPTLENYRIFSGHRFPAGFEHPGGDTCSTACLSSASSDGYALGRFRFRGGTRSSSHFRLPRAAKPTLHSALTDQLSLGYITATVVILVYPTSDPFASW